MTDSTDNARGPERIHICPDDAPREWATPDHHPHMGPWVEYVRADLAPDPLGAVKVKPLVWAQVKSVLPRVVYEAETPLGRYQAWPNGCWRLVGSGAGFQTIDETLEAAKAAAQADYETRIRSALEPCDPLADPRVVALVEALRFYGGVMPVSFSPGQDGGSRARAALAALSPTGGNADG